MPSCPPWLVPMLGVVVSLSAAAGGASPPLLTMRDPLTQAPPKLARPLRLEADRRAPETKIIPALLSRLSAFRPEAQIKVIVLLHEPILADIDHGLTARERDDLRAQHLAALEQDFVADAASHGFSASSGLSHLPIVFGQVRASRLVELARLPSVKAIEDQHLYFLNDVEGGNLTKGILLRDQFGATGSGVGVAIVDTGIDFSHSEFGGRIAAQLNLVGGASGQDDEGHGTKVAGIVAGSTLGMAPQARLWAVKVFDSSGRPTPTSVLAGLNAVYANRNSFGGVRIVNMSLGGGGPFQSDCDDQFPADAAAVDQLVAAGIAVVIASGNDGFRSGVSEPACLSHAIAVGAVYDAAVGPEVFGLPSRCSDASTAEDQIACYSNSGPPLDVLAPAHCATTAKLGGGTEVCYGGTSAAAPYVAGAAAQILSLRPRTSPAQLQTALMTTGRPLTDGANTARDRIDALAAYQSLVAADHSPCVHDANTACLQDGRFEVKVTYANNSSAGDASVMAFGVERADNEESAFFYFTSTTSFEIGVKVLNACVPALGNKHWVFISGLTDQAWQVTVRDTQTGAIRSYSNPNRHLTLTTADTAAFDCP